LKNLVFIAYAVQFYQMSTPSWMDEEYFDIVAKAPSGAAKDDLRPMLQSLLAERFQLRIHHESRDVRGYALRLGKSGSRVKPSPALAPGIAPSVNDGKPPRFDLDKDGFIVVPPGSAGMMTMPPRNGQSRLTASRETMAVFCGYLSRQLQQPVADQTGLTGIYDFHLAFAPEEVAPSVPPPSMDAGNSNPAVQQASEPAPTLVKAVERQLGLKMELQSLPVDFLVIDHVEKKPIEN
jgi:uncharacterized protein (TIGR03435 family)